MMAGTGVSVGGAGMLRTRRRDVSVKPNRKLDRKSSRGMIYENEELRLRTIHINAEVEQGQNDIKKLRRENEQLRREIWSLRDEYDKLEELLKRQKNRSESEEYEDRSEEDDGLQSDFSCEEEEDIEVEPKDSKKPTQELNKEEQLENAENQKISSEKMSSSLHRLHVEFDDLSVVDEEEEPKKDKERKEMTPSGEIRKNEARRPILGPRQLHDNIPFYPAAYEPTSGFTRTSYYAECPFEFPGTVDLMLPTNTSALLASPCSGLPPDPLISLASLDPGLDRMTDSMLPQIHVPPIGWQNDIASQKQSPVFSDTITRNTCSQPEYQKVSSPMGDFVSPDGLSFLKRKNIALRQSTILQDVSAVQGSRKRLSSPEEGIGKNAWNVIVGSTYGKNATKNGGMDTGLIINQDTQDSAAMSIVPERRKHFFAPLPCKLKKQEEESPTASIHFGTGTSSSSGRTASTVISKINPFTGQKSSPDIYVNGAIPCEDRNVARDTDESRTFLSTDNLLITNSRNTPNSQLIKSVSCQNLSSESQTVTQQSALNHVDSRSQMLTKSDNTLDNITNTSPNRPYKSHLNVTLKVPQLEKPSSPETPEIPNLPSIDYRLFRNPFLRNFNKICPAYQIESSPPVTTPLSVQVNSDGLAYQYPIPGYGRGIHLDERYRTAHLAKQNRLLIPSDQLIGGKQNIQVTSFERPSPCTLIPSATSYDLTTLKGLNGNQYLQSQNLYQNIPFVPRDPGQFYPHRSGMMYHDGIATKVPAQTQTSIDGDSHHEDERTSAHQDDEPITAPNSPNEQRRKKIAKRDKILSKDQRPLSPVAQRRLKKQSSVTSTDMSDLPGKIVRNRPRKLSTATTSDAQEDKNESRSSSSGQDSPRKDQNRRVSVYINSKRRSSQTSLKTSRSGSIDATKNKYTDGSGVNSERERTNSISSRETASVKARKTSTSSGNVPWCACWGNGCI